MQENSFIKVYWNWHAFEEKHNKQKYFSLPDHQLAGNLVLVFGFYEKAKSE